MNPTAAIRNFSIIAHIDAGKSTLADRFLELTQAVRPDKMRPQYLDMMDLEREKGITIKMQPVRMIYKVNPAEIRISSETRGAGNTKSETRNNLEFRNSRFEFANSEFILNLIDTPGHVDFSYEVSRSLAAVEGAILLVDGVKGVQAQTLANLELAQKQNLAVVPAINKIDLGQVDAESVKKEVLKVFDCRPEEILLISAKTGQGVENLLKTVIEKVPGPSCDAQRDFRALIFDSKFDSHKGVLAFVRVVDGQIRKGERIRLFSGQTESEVLEVGFFRPEMTPIDSLSTGEIGYLATGIKEPGQVRVGDTVTKIRNSKFEKTAVPPSRNSVEPLPGYQEPQPVVFASFYPSEATDFERLQDALRKLKLNDASLYFEPETKEILGRGFRCGFLGLLHTEITTERLNREFGLDLVISQPSVVYKIKDQQGREREIFTASDWPDPSLGQIPESQELWALVKITAPLRYLGPVFEVLNRLAGRHLETQYLSQEKVLISYEMPLAEIITQLYENLKNVSAGFASMSYQVLGFRPARLVKLDILLAGQKFGAFSKIVAEDRAAAEGKRMAQKLKQLLPRQLFSVAIQATIGGKVVARETLSARGRDVIAPLYGGDYTRKRKLLEQQKKGKEELREKGQLSIPQKVFLEMLRS